MIIKKRLLPLDIGSNLPVDLTQSVETILLEWDCDRVIVAIESPLAQYWPDEESLNLLSSLTHPFIFFPPSYFNRPSVAGAVL